jgi:hypothetical protein
MNAALLCKSALLVESVLRHPYSDFSSATRVKVVQITTFNSVVDEATWVPHVVHRFEFPRLDMMQTMA